MNSKKAKTIFERKGLGKFDETKLNSITITEFFPIAIHIKSTIEDQYFQNIFKHLS